MKWLILSSKVTRPPRRLRAAAPAHRRRKKDPVPDRGSVSRPRSAGGAVLVLILLAALVGGLWWYFRHSELFTVEEIEVVNSHVYSPEEIIEMAGIETGGNIFPLDSAAAREAIIRHQDFREAHVRKIFPSTVRIEVMEREPRARVIFGQYYTIDEEGVVLGPKKSSSERNLPAIRGLKLVNKSNDLYPPEKRAASLELLKELERLEIENLIRIEEISVDFSDRIELKAEGRLDITLGPESYGEQLLRLKAVLEKLGPDLARAPQIDLRYSKVPVRFRD